MIKPAVHIHEAYAKPLHIAEICAGLEEEGIPYTVTSTSGDVRHLAANAANSSRLHVGIGITHEFAMLQMRNCPINIPTNDTTHDNQSPTLYIQLSSPTANSNCRILGTNAARAVKGGIFI
ncbi:MAG: glycerol dehydratase reactivase beta/small subunit family protein [Defluviitaleaceae bacterium]|nr:glycerol dehydratase reactivase beta/small subunit family protein [Defluviitaleaceae bacterium]